LIDVEEPWSPGWWLARCHKKLKARLPELDRLDRYRRGDPPLPRRAEVEKRAFRDFVRLARLNVAETIVSSVTERLCVRAVRTAVEGSQAGDAKAWETYRANGLDVELPDVLDTMCALADAYMIVGVDPAVTGTPTPSQVQITAEDPRQVVTIHDPVRQSRVRAGAKFFHDPDVGADFAYLHTPGKVYVATRTRRATTGSAVPFSPTSWSWSDEHGGPEGTSLPDGLDDVVGIVRFRNRHGTGEYEPHTDVLDRINHVILQRVVIVTMQAFRQRALKGDFPSVYPADWPEESLRGRRIDYDQLFVSSPDALWLLPGAAEVWESAQADVQGVLSAAADDLKHLAVVTRRPMWIFAPDNQSASGADRAAEGLVFAVEDRARRAGNALAQVMSLALRFQGETDRARLDKITVDWMPFERHSLGTRAAAARDARTAGMSSRWIMEHVWQATPEEVAIEEQAVAADRLAAALLTVTDTAGAVPGAA